MTPIKLYSSQRIKTPLQPNLIKPYIMKGKQNIGTFHKCKNNLQKSG